MRKSAYSIFKYKGGSSNELPLSCYRNNDIIKIITQIVIETVERFDAVRLKQTLFVGAVSLGRGYSPLEFALNIFAHSNENTAREIRRAPMDTVKNTALLLDERM
jgi:hypothetical protein